MVSLPEEENTPEKRVNKIFDLMDKVTNVPFLLYTTIFNKHHVPFNSTQIVYVLSLPETIKLKLTFRGKARNKSVVVNKLLQAMQTRRDVSCKLSTDLARFWFV